MKIELLSITKNAEKLIEDAGRTSYASYDKKTKNSYKKFIKMIIRQGHFSVLEHAFAIFRVDGVSRALTHQLVRHRLCSFIQRSQRYINEQDFDFIIPPDIKKNEKALKLFTDHIKDVQKIYLELRNNGIKKEDARFILPNCVSSEIVIGANLRQWRHIIKLRGEKHAQWEIRQMAVKILMILKKETPTVFGDFYINKRENIIYQNGEEK